MNIIGIPDGAPDKAIELVFSILRSAAAQDCPIPATDLYREGWLLRLALAIAKQGIRCLPFDFAPGSRWFSEAQLPSPFIATRRGEPNTETRTHPDAVVGHFGIASDTKSGLLLNEGGSQFVVIESKVNSKLRQGTKNAPGYDQAVRTVACMAEALRIRGSPLEEWDSLGFYVFAPLERINTGDFDREMSKDSMRQKIDLRISRCEPPRQVQLKEWQSNWALPVIDQITLKCWPWESMITSVEQHDPLLGRDLRRFYDLTLWFNGPNRTSCATASGTGFDIIPIQPRT